jgi:hypothetical protein
MEASGLNSVTVKVASSIGRRQNDDVRPVSELDRVDTTRRSLAFDAEIIVEDSYCPVGINGNVEILMHQEVVPRPLADDAEIVYEGFVKRETRHVGVEIESRYPCALIIGTGGQTHAVNSLRVVVNLKVETVAIDGHRKQIVEVSAQADYFPGSSSCAGNKDDDTDWKAGVA